MVFATSRTTIDRIICVSFIIFTIITWAFVFLTTITYSDRLVKRLESNIKFVDRIERADDRGSLHDRLVENRIIV
ncbi:hypothetical protein SNEBB_006387 [Seison nebaliae]|nr:hypothetical protein SNEBB_006387 [Seison nebaliae]